MVSLARQSAKGVSWSRVSKWWLWWVVHQSDSSKNDSGSRASHRTDGRQPDLWGMLNQNQKNVIQAIYANGPMVKALQDQIDELK